MKYMMSKEEAGPQESHPACSDIIRMDKIKVLVFLLKKHRFLTNLTQIKFVNRNLHGGFQVL
jgi:hypothetical protein